MDNKRYCFNCKKVISKNALHCSNCGENQKKYNEDTKIRCSYCNKLVSKNAKFCDICGTPVSRQDDILSDNSNCLYDFSSKFICEISNCFKNNVLCNVYAKDKKIKIATFGHGSKSYDICEDFYYCENVSFNSIKMMNLDSTKKYVKIIFNDDYVILEHTLATENILCYIYKTLNDCIYEAESGFYNTNHKKFTFF